MNDLGSIKTRIFSNIRILSPVLGSESREILYDRPEHPPPTTPKRKPPSTKLIFSLVRRECILLTAFGVICMIWRRVGELILIFQLNTTMQYHTLKCAYCHQKFQRSSRAVASSRTKKTINTFCSDNCAANFQVTSVEVSCKQCTKKFKKRLCQLRENNFCSLSCNATYRNLHKTVGNRRSLLEVYLEAQIRLKFPHLTLLCNDKTTIDSELDFFFPELQLAIELNGILHFEPIYGAKKLGQIQSNDDKKAFLCGQKQIDLAIIDSSSCKYLNQAAKEKYWILVEEVIRKSGGESGI